MNHYSLKPILNLIHASKHSKALRLVTSCVKPIMFDITEQFKETGTHDRRVMQAKVN